jgi:hypothetical protein
MPEKWVGLLGGRVSAWLEKTGSDRSSCAGAMLASLRAGQLDLSKDAKLLVTRCSHGGPRAQQAGNRSGGRLQTQCKRNRSRTRQPHWRESLPSKTCSLKCSSQSSCIRKRYPTWQLRSNAFQIRACCARSCNRQQLSSQKIYPPNSNRPRLTRFSISSLVRLLSL